MKAELNLLNKYFENQSFQNIFGCNESVSDYKLVLNLVYESDSFQVLKSKNNELICLKIPDMEKAAAIENLKHLGNKFVGKTIPPSRD